MFVCTTFTCKADLEYLKEADAILGTNIADSYEKNHKSEAEAPASEAPASSAAAAIPDVTDVDVASAKKRGRPAKPEGKAKPTKKLKPAE